MLYLFLKRPLYMQGGLLFSFALSSSDRELHFRMYEKAIRDMRHACTCHRAILSAFMMLCTNLSGQRLHQEGLFLLSEKSAWFSKNTATNSDDFNVYIRVVYREVAVSSREGDSLAAMFFLVSFNAFLVSFPDVKWFIYTSEPFIRLGTRLKLSCTLRCLRKKDEDIRLFRIPADGFQRKRWIAAIGFIRTSPHCRICNKEHLGVPRWLP